jgi:predicted 3-demethylubiquinone-9 3-methyltransferase (glyoxalase superfamily)
MPTIRPIVPCLWFNDQAEEAARFYAAIFERSSIGKIARYSKEGHEVHGRPAGSVMAVSFELNGQKFTALNGGPLFKFSEAISFEVHCETQAELDHFWERLSAGGDPKSQQCGWLKDRYGVSWQIVPTVLSELIADSDSTKSERVMKAMLKMKKLDIALLKRAAEG